MWLYSVAMTTASATPPATIRRAVQVLDGFTPGQGSKAIDLITSGRIRHAGRGRYRVEGSGGAVYWTTADGCTCPACVPCYHRAAAQVMNVVRRPPALSPDAEDGYRAEQADEHEH